MKKIVGSILDLSTKAVFSLDKYLLKNTGWKLCFCYSTYRKKKKFYWSASPPVTKLILLHTIVVLHFTHHIKTAWLVTGGGGGNDVKMLKNTLL